MGRLKVSWRCPGKCDESRVARAGRWLGRGKDRVVGWLKLELWKVPQWLWLIALVPWMLFSLFLLLWRPWPENPDAFWYLLSALSQGMAAVLALTFSISLVAAQLSARYSYRLIGHLLTPVTIAYILLFVLAIVLPLTLLPSPTSFQVKLSLSLGALTLVLLVPYFRYFLYRVTPRSLLDELTHDGERNLQVGQKAPEIQTIDNMAMSAFSFKDYDTFAHALGKLASLALVERKKMQLVMKPGETVTRRMQDMSLTVLDDPRAAELSILALEQLGTAGVQKKLFDTVLLAGEALAQVGYAAAGKKLEDAADEAAGALWSIGLAAVEKRQGDAALETSVALEAVAKAAAQNDMLDATERAASGLLSLGTAAAKKGLDHAAEHAADTLKELRATKTGKQAVKRALQGVVFEVEEKDLDQFLRHYCPELQKSST